MYAIITFPQKLNCVLCREKYCKLWNNKIVKLIFVLEITKSRGSVPLERWVFLKIFCKGLFPASIRKPSGFFINFNENLIKVHQKHSNLCSKYIRRCLLNRSNICLWLNLFLEGRESLKDEKHIVNYRSASLKVKCFSLNVGKETIRTILQENLGKTKVCSKCVPHKINDD